MPPSADAVLRAGPLVFASFAVPAVAMTASMLTERLSSEELAEQKEESCRRAKHVTEMVDILVKTQDATPEDAGEASSGEKASGQSPGQQEPQEDSDDEGSGQIQFEDLFVKVNELAAIAPGVPELGPGIEWCGKLLLKELLLATRKTKGQKDVKFSNGEKLDIIMDQVESLDNLARRARHAVPKGLRAEVHAAYNSGWWVRRAQRSKDIIKAAKFVLMARDTLPWLLLAAVASSASSSIGSMSLYYRSEVLQTLRAPGRGAFKRATSAMLMVELVSTAASALESQLRARSLVLMSESLQVRMFDSLFSKDLAWWANQKPSILHEVWGIPSRLQQALMTPLELINRISSICVQAALVRQNSSSMLRAMVALHWARFLAQKGLSWMERWLIRKATSGIVMPSEDRFTWPYALRPENIQMYQSFARGPKESLSLGKFVKASTKTRAIGGSIRSLCEPLFSLASQGGSVAELASMGQLIQQGSLDITQAETILNYATEAASEMEHAYQDIRYAQDRLVPLAKAYDYIDIPPKISLDVGLEPGKRATGHFVFDNVCFRYPGKKAELLKGVSFEVKPGQTVGITGSSGCGKSTCLRLVERFYDVTGGQIMLDGRDIRDYKPQWLRSQIVAVEQEPKLLPVAIRENLAFGCDHDPTLEEIERACRAANIWDALQDPQKFPNGLETKIKAVQNVSGGEKQRLCIARAILADPPILLLDEATSTLDEISQADVQTALVKLMQGRTTLVVAHRLSTIKGSDKIIGMRDGRVVDDGTHEELLAKEDGVWKQLWLKQGASDDPSPSVEAKLPPPTLQRSTSVVGKFELLRRVVNAMSAEPDDRRVAMDIISELEAQASEDSEALEEVSPADELVPTRLSKSTTVALTPTLGAKGHWGKIRGMAHMGVLKARAAELHRAKTCG